MYGFELPCSVQALRFLAPHYDDRAGEGANIVHCFVGDFGNITARLWSGAGESRGRQIDEATFPMTPPSARHPDFYARYAVAYAAELSAFVDCIRRKAPFDPGPNLGWKTLLVANLAEASSRSGGRRFDLGQAAGSAIATVADAAAYGAACSPLV